MLIDGGGSLRDGGSDPGERLLAPALRSLGVDRLDWVVLTHPHPDHLRGLLHIASTFPVGEFWHGPDSDVGGDYRDLASIMMGHGVPVRSIDSTTADYGVGDVRIEALAPSPGNGVVSGSDQAGDRNETSLVLCLKIHAFSVLFTGDAGFATEETLLHRPERLHCSIMKVGHHGSRYASSDRFICATAPKYAVISAGFGNSFGLPAAETLERFNRHGVRIFRTDRDGTVQAIYDPATGLFRMRTLSGSFY
jgi:competence protein ComEC